MSKTINIQQTGVDNPLTVDRLRTTDAGDWVPEDAAQVDALTVNGNGTFTAKSKNVYGFDEVVVNVTSGGSGSTLAGNPHTGEIIPVDPSILEGEVARVMGGTKRLKVDLSGGGTALYVPKQGLELGTLYATKNGRYRAAADGYYAYSEVNANVDISGGGGGGGGEGGEGGITGLAASIKVTTPPTYTGPYGDGAYISFEGIEVTAYDANGDSLGVVPFSELVFPVTVAVYDPDAEAQGAEYTSEFAQVFGSSTVKRKGVTESANNPYLYTESVSNMQGAVAMGYAVQNGNRVIYYTIVASKTEIYSESIVTKNYKVETGDLLNTSYVTYDDIRQDSQYSHDGKVAYWSQGSRVYYNNVMTPEFSPLSSSPSVALGEIAWTMVYGEMGESSGGVQIPVQWPRTGDGQMLQTSFGITVVDTSYGTN